MIHFYFSFSPSVSTSFSLSLTISVYPQSVALEMQSISFSKNKKKTVRKSQRVLFQCISVKSIPIYFFFQRKSIYFIWKFLTCEQDMCVVLYHHLCIYFIFIFPFEFFRLFLWFLPIFVCRYSPVEGSQNSIFFLFVCFMKIMCVFQFYFYAAATVHIIGVVCLVL